MDKAMFRSLTGALALAAVIAVAPAALAETVNLKATLAGVPAAPPAGQGAGQAAHYTPPQQVWYKADK
jgi:hypothetical protein